MNDWQPISTAPKDGQVLCVWPGGWRSIVETRTLPLMRPAPTHWMPLPDPPDALSEATPMKLDDGRLMLNEYGRRCYDAGLAAALRDIKREANSGPPEASLPALEPTQ